MTGIDSVTTAALTAALDATSLRQQAIATNIAHASVAGRAAERVRFEAVWTSARDGATRSPLPLATRSEPLLDASGRPAAVQLDREVAALAENTLHHQALVRGLSRHLGLLASAASEGKR